MPRRPGFAALRLVVPSLLLIAGCRSDSITAPVLETSCDNALGCRVIPNVPIDPNVLIALADARERLVPNLDDTPTRSALASALKVLESNLLDNRTAEARESLVLAHVYVDRLSGSNVGNNPLDSPDMSAIRLALLTVTTALGLRASS